MKTLRLITTLKCDRNCLLCANKSIDFSKVPVVSIESKRWNSLIKNTNEICITGGEPLIFAEQLGMLLTHIQDVPKRILYSSKTYSLFFTLNRLFTHLTLTIRTLGEIEELFENYKYKKIISELKSNIRIHIDVSEAIKKRFNVNKIINELKTEYPEALIKELVWIENCPIPKNEVLYCLNPLWK